MFIKPRATSPISWWSTAQSRRVKIMSEHNRHHKLARSNGGNCHVVNGHRNIVYVPVKKHRAFHTLFENLSAQAICQIINDTWLDPNYQFICVPRQKGNYRKRKRDNKNNTMDGRSDCD